MFLSFQYPFEIEGLGFRKFLFQAYKARFPEKEINALEFNKLLKEKAKELQMPEEMVKRDLNVGFSGGEKKRAEILQMKVFNPKLAILDETDSGLDIDSLRLVAESVNSMKSPEFSALVITHYKRILNYLQPDFVHVLVKGKIIATGDKKLADELEEKGYSWLLEKEGFSKTEVQEIEKEDKTAIKIQN
ncbi:MAG: Fe-S cluster assembly ATPase SufC [Candidatus Diapherotrites archaeon]|nr:Fe-S cluster assembly ATPase SufC [Candidatus Diapherotrites archaeon]